MCESAEMIGCAVAAAMSTPLDRRPEAPGSARFYGPRRQCSQPVRHRRRCHQGFRGGRAGRRFLARRPIWQTVETVVTSGRDGCRPKGESTVPLLTPYRVLDLTDERGHLAGLILAQLGADVIAIEPP